MQNENVNAFDATVAAAKSAGSPFPESVAECLMNRVSIQDSLSGQQVFVWNGNDQEPLSVAMTRLKCSDDIGPLFTDGKLDVRKLSVDAYQAVRRRNPELLGLRKKRRFY